MKSKKGSHVGVILSFMIFVVFLVFLFSALQPALKVEKDKEAILEHITNSITESSSDNLIIENVVVDNTDESDCVRVDKNLDQNLIVKKSPDWTIASYLIQGGEIDIKLEGGKFFKIYYSESIVETLPSSVICNKITTNYKIGFVNNETVVFVSKFDDLTNKDYDLLKRDFGVSAGTDFSFSLLDADKILINQIIMKAPKVSTNIYVNEFPVLYSDENGEIKSGFINVKVW